MDALAVTEAGTPARPTIVFLHGSGTTAPHVGWASAQRRGLTTALSDLPGDGRGLQLRSKSLIETADRVTELIDTGAAEVKRISSVISGRRSCLRAIATDQAGR